MNTKQVIRSVATLSKQNNRLKKVLANSSAPIQLAALRDQSADYVRRLSKTIMQLQFAVDSSDETRPVLERAKTLSVQIANTHESAYQKLNALIRASYPEFLSIDALPSNVTVVSNDMTALCNEGYTQWQPVQALHVAKDTYQVTLFACQLNRKIALAYGFNKSCPPYDDWVSGEPKATVKQILSYNGIHV